MSEFSLCHCYGMLWRSYPHMNIQSAELLSHSLTWLMQRCDVSHWLNQAINSLLMAGLCIESVQ